MTNNLKQLFCLLSWHRFKKIDKNIHHDFLVCQKCSKRKFRFKEKYLHQKHWIRNEDFSKRPIIEAWLNGESYEKTRQELF